MTENYGIEGLFHPSIFFFLVPDKQWGGARGESIIFGFICTYFRGAMLIKYVFLNITP